MRTQLSRVCVCVCVLEPDFIYCSVEKQTFLKLRAKIVSHTISVAVTVVCWFCNGCLVGSAWLKWLTSLEPPMFSGLAWFSARPDTSLQNTVAVMGQLNSPNTSWLRKDCGQLSQQIYITN